MRFKELLKKRYSVRAFLPVEVEQAKIDYILECARLAPSACNFQPWFFCVATSDESREVIQESYNREWFKNAPVYIIICGNREQSWKRDNDNKDYLDIDMGIVGEHICLAAASAGLGTCWVCNYTPDVLNTFLALPDHLEPLAIFPIGYIDEERSKPIAKKRKSISEIVKWL